MIVPTYTENEILSELIRDYYAIKRAATKIAKQYLKKTQKSGVFLRKIVFESYTITTDDKNVWNVEFEYDQRNKVPWLFRACCIVEGDKKTKDYYILRGVNTDKPYYVKVTTHALLRVKERNHLEKFGNVSLPTLACWTFEHREIAICTRFVELKYEKLLLNMDDVDEIDDMSYLVIVNRGAYYALRTHGGNFVFKTYISSMMGVEECVNFNEGKINKWNNEGQLISRLLIVHQYYNQQFYDKETLNNILYTAYGKNPELKLKDDSPIILLKN